MIETHRRASPPSLLSCWPPFDSDPLCVPIPNQSGVPARLGHLRSAMECLPFLDEKASSGPYWSRSRGEDAIMCPFRRGSAASLEATVLPPRYCDGAGDDRQHCDARIRNVRVVPTAGLERKYCIAQLAGQWGNNRAHHHREWPFSALSPSLQNDEAERAPPSSSIGALQEDVSRVGAPGPRIVSFSNARSVELMEKPPRTAQ
jgi:hypothetical protein